MNVFSFTGPGTVSHWAIYPADAYTIIDQSGNSIQVKWNSAVSNGGVDAYYNGGQVAYYSPVIISNAVTPSVTISANKNNICAGTSVTFTATPTNGGGTPGYYWYVNGNAISGANGSTYSSSTLSNGDVVTCSMNTSAPCYTSYSATSNAITMVVNQPQALSISISGSTSVCAGSSASFNAVVSNPPSTGTLTYQWKKNGANVGSDYGTPPPYVLALSSVNNNDVISCVVSTTAGCYTSGTSNSLTITVNPKQTFTASVGPNKIGMCQNESITFTAGSSHPASSYQWVMNGVNVGSNINTFTTTASSVAQLQSVKVTVTTNAGCLNNNSAIGSASAIPFTITPTVGTPSTPSGPLTRNIGSGTGAYTTSATNATSYAWSISPAGAGTISGTGTTGTVTWNAAFSGTATIGVKANGCNGPSAQTTRTVTVYPPVTMTVSPSSKTINYNTSPGLLNNTPGGGNGSYTYVWEKGSSSNGPWSQVATTQDYTPPALTTTTYYKVTTASNGAPPVTTIVTITVYPQVTTSVSPSGKTINYNTSPGILNNTPGGGNGSYTYVWEKGSSSNGPWSQVATTQDYTPPALTATTYYRVTTTSNGVPATTIVTITVYPQVTTSVSPTSKTINYNESPGLLNNTPGGGNGNYTYVWEKASSSGGPWTQVATTQDYTPPSLTTTTFYKVTTTSNGVPASTIVTITVYPQLVVGAITPSADQVLNYNAAATPLTIGGVSGGSGTYTYQWQRSAMTSFDDPVNVGSNTTSFTPPTNSSSIVGTYYYRVVVKSNGVPLNSSNYVSVKVYPLLVAGTLSPSSITVNYNEDMGQITGTAATGGTGSYSYRWQGSMDGSTWTAIAGTAADDLNYSPGIAMPGGYLYYRRRVLSNGVYKYTTAVQIIVPFNGGTVSSSAATVNSGGSATLTSVSEASGGSCTGSPTYQWQSSTDEQNWVDIPGTSLTNITQSTYYRRLATCGDDQAASNTILIKVTAAIAVIKPISATAPVAGTQTLIPMPDYDASLDPENMNYIKTRVFMQPGITTVTAANAITDKKSVQQSTTYYDGLGRDMQTVTRQSTPAGHDMVSTTFYDEFGRVAQQWLPYADNAGTGKFRTDAVTKQTDFYNSYLTNTEGYYYGNTVYEASPLNRVLKTTAPGKSWTGHDVGVSQLQRANDTYDEVVIWNIGFAWGNLPAKAGFYSPGALYVMETSDEQLNKTIEYKDKEGHIVLKKVQIANAQQTGHTGWLCTYYVYDDLGNLRCVMQPKAVEYLEAHGWAFETTAMSTSPTAKEFCFLYFYDERNRMVVKRVPGAEEVQMVYDKRDRLVMTQDGNLRALSTKKWQYTIYDDLNRPTGTGLLNSNATRATLQSNADARPEGDIDYPVLSNFTHEDLTQTFYDDYTWNGKKAYNGSYTANLDAGTNPYAEAVTQSNQTKGLVTGTKTKVLGTSTWLISTIYYDEKGRVIQTLADNVAGGVDITTSQYDFSGKVLSSFTDHKNPLATATPETKVLTRMEYDHAGRVRFVYKKVNTDAEKKIVDDNYDELGRLKSKKLAPGYDGGTSLETLAYLYNIRGWLSAINKGYARANNDNNYFGELLNYDYGFNKSAYNGNIAGVWWRSKGDGERRAYGFDYDNANRLLKADFTQNNGGWNTSKGIDFSVGGDPQTGGVMQYDANGNIMMMWQKGVKLGNSTGTASDYIDQLTYHYEHSEGSNQLQNVIDAKTDKNTPLGDFRYSALYEQTVTTNKPVTAVDYDYDANGNLIMDKNKDIKNTGDITYNYLNLPQVITVAGKGSIEYVYDAAGNKLKKIVHETNKPDKTTLYLMGVYQDNVLQYLPQEEGRVRYKPAVGTDPASFQYDYFIKDHLGNVRMVLTEEEKTDTYPVLSFEGASGSATVTNQDAVWSNAAGDAVDVVGTRTGRPANMGNPSDNGNNVKLVKKSSSGGAIGAAMLLKVMSGDQINTSVEYYWPSATVKNESADGIGTLLSSLALALVNSPDVSASIKGAVPSVNSAINADPNVLSQITNPENNTTTSGNPKAYLHVLLFDEQFTFDNINSQILQIEGANQTSPLSKVVPVKKNGYAYIYFSNESNNDVFFDNFRVTYKRGRILEENHYYPFGLTMAGISSKALSFGDPGNKYKYNGIENNTDFDLNTYEAYYRTNDPQIGRWWGIDTKPDFIISPYSSMANNPVLLTDFLGDTTQYYNIKTGALLGTINNAGAVSRVKVNALAYNVAIGTAGALGYDLTNQDNANTFVSTFNNTLSAIDNTTGLNTIALETTERSLNFDGSNLNVQSHFDDNSTLTINSIPASSGIRNADGTYNYDPLPNGEYTVNNGRRRGRNEAHGGFYRDGVAFTFDVNPNFTQVNGQPMSRTELRIHPDGNRPGSAGCVALATDQRNLQAFYTQTGAYVRQNGNIQLTVTDPNNPNVPNNRHAADRRRPGE
ncbi:DUF6443 domain-containing protein [Parafilimonas sp.]|uniref:DUF6443 domain-containing protein n=1 Tax=Parafilimonas sp. TaxID=1969739 RepID=UPI003F82375A